YRRCDAMARDFPYLVRGRSRNALLPLLGVALLAAACAPAASAPPAAAPQPAPAAQASAPQPAPAAPVSAPQPATPAQVSVMLNWVVDGGYTPYLYGIEKGFFREQGIELDMIPGRGGDFSLAQINE